MYPEINIEMLPASNGDCFLISIKMNQNEKSIHILIDCGLKSTFQNSLKKRLTEISGNNETISRLIITHIDADHINGAIPLLESNGISGASKIVEIEQIWHNTFRHIQFDKVNKELSFSENEILNNLVVSGYPKEATALKEEREIGAEASMSLGSLILENKYSWNDDSNGKAICIENSLDDSIHEDISICLLSPSKKKLEKLSKDFIDKIEQLGLSYINKNERFDDAFEYLVSKLEKKNSVEKEASSNNINIAELSSDILFAEDKTAPNGSSIAFVLNIKNHHLLFLGDSHPSQIAEQLKVMYPNESEYPIYFDAIKVSHHGSNGNTSPELLKIMDSKNYFISTNGKGHGRHPDKETISRIVNRPSKYIRTLYFNYKTKTSSLFEEQELKNKYLYNIEYVNKPINILQ